MARMVINSTEFETSVQEFIERAKSPAPPLIAWGQYMVGSVKKNFREEGRPDPWKPLKVNTLVARFLSRAGNRKLQKTGGQFSPNPNVFKQSRGRLSAGDSSAVTTVSGFARSPKTGRVLRSRHGGMNKFAPQGMVFRRPALRAILEGKILQDYGKLRESITSSMKSGSEVQIGTNLVYAGTHQFGNPKLKIPARPFLVVQQDDEAEFVSLLMDWLTGAWGGNHD